jgi:guanylate kinase
MSNSGHPKDHGRRRGLMLVLSSPSGAGKTTLSKMLLEEFTDVKLSVSATTRPPRPGEVDGKDYHFRTPDQFKDMIARGEFLEWAFVFDKYYGTPKADTVARLEAGEDVLFDVDWQGADALHSQRFSLFITCSRRGRGCSGGGGVWGKGRMIHPVRRVWR